MSTNWNENKLTFSFEVFKKTRTSEDNETLPILQISFDLESYEPNTICQRFLLLKISLEKDCKTLLFTRILKSVYHCK